MKLPLLTVVAGILIGYAVGGRLRNLGELKMRFLPAVLIGLVMQMVPLPRSLEGLGVALLVASFIPLGIFVGANIRLPGVPVVMLGLLLNFAVIAANQGMPVTHDALVGSGQADTLQLLIEEGGARHQLATPDTVLLPLGDVIPVGGFVGRAVSVGDLVAYAGVAWVLAAGMRRRRDLERLVPSGPSPPLEAAAL